MDASAMTAGYEMAGPPARHGTTPGRRTVATSWVIVAAATVAVAVATGSPLVGGLPATVALLVHRPVLAAVLALLAVVGAARAEQSWRALVPDRLGPVDEWTRVVGEPQRYPAATR